MGRATQTLGPQTYAAVGSHRISKPTRSWSGLRVPGGSLSSSQGERKQCRRRLAALCRKLKRYSVVGSRRIRLPTSSCRGLPPSTAQTPFVIGSSIPSRCERSRSTGAVVSPSTVIPI